MFGQRLKELREEKGLTQKQLADLIDLSQQTIGHYEVKRAEPTPKALILFANIFDTTTDYLLGRSNQRYPIGYSVSEKKSNYLVNVDRKVAQNYDDTKLQSIVRQAEEILTPEEKKDLIDLIKLYTRQAERRRNK